MKTLLAMGAATLVGMAGWTASVSADGCGAPCAGVSKTSKTGADCAVACEGEGQGASVRTVAMSARGDIVDIAVGAGSFSTLVAAVQAAGLVDVLKGDGPFTVFAPTDEAFAKLPSGTVEELLKPENREKLVSILTYHVVPGRVLARDVVGLSAATTVNGQRAGIRVRGENVMIDNARVVATDVTASNGVIHVIDSVIMPETRNLLEVAGEAGTFTTLATAIKAAGLTDVLTGDTALTVFAPTDEAFAKLPAGTVENLLKPENREQLVAILTYHVVPGRVFSDQALEAGEASTVQGQSVQIRTRYGTPRVQNARITATDIQARNGVIHVIDTVILPE